MWTKLGLWMRGPNVEMSEDLENGEDLGALLEEGPGYFKM